MNLTPTDPSGPSSSSYPPAPIPHSADGAPLTLRALLTNHLDILSIPRRSFFALLAHFASDAFQRERLHEFANPVYLDELYDYTTRPRRSTLEVLQEFSSVAIPWQRVASTIPPLRGRQFSIASGGRLKSGPAAETRIELLVAIVAYRTVIKRLRRGVCTRYVAALRPGQRLSVTLQRGGLAVSRAEARTPVVMVGPGTGVAPMRALVHERLAWWEDEGLPKPAVGDVLFFGCRNRDRDFFFRAEWEGLRERVEVLPAFSRDQVSSLPSGSRGRVRRREADGKGRGRRFMCRTSSAGMRSACMRRSLRTVVWCTSAGKSGPAPSADPGACVLTRAISRSSGKMPQAVREALIEVFQSEGGLARTDAEAYLSKMEKEGRYKQETW